ncbi:glycosyltransferase family 4 protein [Sphingomonas aestuarii]
MTSYKIVYSHDIFDAQSVGGISRYYREIRREIQSLENGPGVVFFSELLGALPISRRSINNLFYIMSREIKLWQYLKKSCNVLLHRTYYPIFDFSPRNVSVIHTIHDMYDEEHDRFSLRKSIRSHLKYRAAKRADFIICVSQFTMDRLSFLWPEFSKKARLIHHGVTRLPHVEAREPNIPYALFVGKRDNYKNFLLVLKAISKVPDIRLVCVGGGMPSHDETTEIQRLELRDRVIFTNANDAQLGELYTNAEFFVYPSCYEGFGLPILESFANGCPVILANIPVFREVAGSAAVFVDTDDWLGWAETMRSIMGDRVFRAHLVSAGYQRVSNFQWESAAARHICVYDELMDTSK